MESQSVVNAGHGYMSILARSGRPNRIVGVQDRQRPQDPAKSFPALVVTQRGCARSGESKQSIQVAQPFQSQPLEQLGADLQAGHGQCFDFCNDVMPDGRHLCLKSSNSSFIEIRHSEPPDHWM
jgi:hypothetical protein